MVLDPFLKKFALNIDRGLTPVNFSEPTRIKISEEKIIRNTQSTKEQQIKHTPPGR